MARDTSNVPVVNLPLAYKFDGNGNIIQKVFFGVNAVFGPVWYWWYFKSNRDPNFWLGDSEMDGYDPDECSTEFLHRMDNFTPEESCNLFEVAKYCDRMTGVTVFDVVNDTWMTTTPATTLASKMMTRTKKTTQTSRWSLKGNLLAPSRCAYATRAPASLCCRPF